ncbi:hypothetical protein A8144_01490 [Mycobacterium leprae 3125609]|nr:hypothetical protein A8144_01490 [Mycobacterium leprae 3125609]OAX72155.1 hypothetical protein A3216_01560 [Mycobacterium leprae 7935681]
MVFMLLGDPVVALAAYLHLLVQLRTRYHLDDPFLLQYLRYLGGILHGDSGRYYFGLSVSAVLAHAFPVTFRLALIVLTVESALSYWIRRDRRHALVWNFRFSVLLTGLIIIIAIPIFVLGSLAQFVFEIRLLIAPITVGERAMVALLLLPRSVLISMLSAHVVRLTGSAVVANAYAYTMFALPPRKGCSGAGW